MSENDAAATWIPERKCWALDQKHFREHHDPETGECRNPPVAWEVLHRDGISWHDAPTPRRWHRCKPQSRGFGVERCACGAVRDGDGLWLERNSRRRRQ